MSSRNSDRVSNSSFSSKPISSALPVLIASSTFLEKQKTHNPVWNPLSKDAKHREVFQASDKAL